MQDVVSIKQLTYTKEYQELYKKTDFNKIDVALLNVDLKN